MAQKISVDTILIVDDVQENIQLLAALLQHKYKLHFATDGFRALEIAASAQMPDLILLDVMMPNINGYDICRNLKKNPETKHIPIIFITALSKDTEEAKGLELGAVDYITKPFNPAIVKARVETHLQLKRMFDEQKDLVARLEESLNKVKLLTGLLPVCTHCKKIRAKQGEWQNFESYMTTRSEARFSHGICPDCMDRYYPFG